MESELQATTDDSGALHVPVLSDEAIELLAPERGGLFVDATLGLGGHAEALLDRAPSARLVGIDKDPDARAHAARRLARFGDRVEIVAGDFRDVDRFLGERRAAGLLADLGVSSLQLDSAARGFSFRADGPLDMRMSDAGETAAELLARLTEEELTEILSSYGEEPEARRVARTLVRERATRPIESTAELRALVRRAKRGGRDRKIDPATLVFQALRIAVNDELASLSALLERAVQLLDRGGRLVVISYHSLEDRAVKHRFRELARGEIDPITGRSLSGTRLLEVLTRKPVVPTEAEIARNPRARSARLRAARRL